MNIIGYNITPDGIFNSRGESRIESPYLDWLLEQSDAIQVVYDVDYNFACLMRLIGLEPFEAKKLMRDGRVYLPPGYTIKYFPEKSFMISKGKFATSHFSDMGQFLPGKPFEKGVEHIAYDVAQRVYRVLTELGLHPTTLTSPIAPYRKEIMSRLDIPTFRDIPEKPLEYAINCCKGGWVECFSKGHFDQAWDYDINSAYPFYASLLPDVRKGHWVNYKEIPDRHTLGFVRATIRMDAQLHPVIYKTENRLNFTPTGEWEEYLTLKQARFIRDNFLGEVKPIDAWVFQPTGRTEMPLLRQALYELYQMKQEATSIEKEVIKRILVGIYGSFLQWYQRDNKPGDFYNPIYGAQIETNTRLKIAQTCLDHNIIPLHIAVDGFITDKPISLLLSPQMGGWKLSWNAPALVMGSGAVAIQGDWRGKDFSLDYNKLLGELQDNPQAKSLQIKASKPITLGKALRDSSLWSRLGEFEDTSRSIEFRQDTYRIHRPEINNAEDFLKTKTQSYAWDVSIINPQTHQIFEKQGA